MEAHVLFLSGTCRLCCNKLKTKPNDRTYAVADYFLILNRLFGIDVKSENKDVYPERICNPCSRLLYRAQQDSGGAVDGSLPTFEHHSDNDCFCTAKHVRKVRPFTLRGALVSKKKVFQGEAKKQGLILVYQSDDQDVYQTFGFDNGCVVSDGKKLVVGVDEWRVTYNNREVSMPWCLLPRNLGGKSVDIITTFLSSVVCIGNDDFADIIQAKIDIDGLLKNKEGEVIGVMESSNGVAVKHLSTIRSPLCHLLAEKLRCPPCSRLRDTLHHRRTNMKKKSAEVSVSKHMRIDLMDRNQLERRLRDVGQELSTLKRENSKLKALVEKTVSTNGVQIHGHLGEICTNVLNKDCPAIGITPDSPAAFLWEQQKKAALSRKGMRWHPLMIRWCVSIYLKSPSTYRHLRDTGFMILPDRTTLNKYFNFTEGRSGFNPEIVKLLVDQIKNYEDFQRNVGIAFDEMKIKSGLVYNKASGKLVGFCEMGDMNAELMKFNDDCEKNSQDLATYMLCIMAKGLFSGLSFPLAYFSGLGFTSDQLYNVIWQAVGVLEAISLKVRFFCSDGASPNRSFYNLHRLEEKENVSKDGALYWTYNVHAPCRTRKIYFISDVPHLLKTTRNCFANSHAHSNTRNLVIKGTEVSWQHIARLHSSDICANEAVPGFYQTKLRTEHIYLTSRSRMTVSLAVQVLSKSVHDALEAQGDPATVQTRRLVLFMNRFFDCLNVSRFMQESDGVNRDLLPFSAVDDPRLAWLKNEFLVFINDWEEEANSHVELTKKERGRLCLSKKTMYGLRLTVHSFVDMIPELLKIPGVKYVLTDKASQDDVEEHFFKHRSGGGANDNPSALDYQRNELKIQICKTDMLRIFGNSKGKDRGTSRVDTSDATSLPKKQKLI